MKPSEYYACAKIAAERDKLKTEVDQLKTNQVPENAKSMACARCNVENCDWRWDRYNLGCEPRIDCLATK